MPPAITYCCAGTHPANQIEVRPDDKDPIVVPGPVHTDPAEVDGPVDVVLLAVKDTQNQEARRVAGAAVRRPHRGLRPAERRRTGRTRGSAAAPRRTVVPAVVWFSAEPHPDGWVRLRTGVRLVLPDTDAARTAGRSVRQHRYRRRAGSGLRHRGLAQTAGQRRRGRFMVLTGRRTGMFRRDDVDALARRYLAECLAVARAEGADLADGVVDEIVGMLRQGARGHDDVDADRPRGPSAGWSGTSATASSARKAARARAGHSDQRRAWCHCSQRRATGPARHPRL